MKKEILMTAVLMAMGGMMNDISAHDVYQLNPVTVTAQRIETTALSTPATETVINSRKIKTAGYKNAFDVIEHQVGISSTGYGDAGQDFGFSSGRTIIRGYDRGTLVMVDGIPLNLKNYNSLEGIPVDMIKKVEIVKGASGTLYGAEAMGGVINIITKTNGMKKTHTKITTTYGNYFKNFGVTSSGKNFLISASREYISPLAEANDYPIGSSINWNNGNGIRNKLFVSTRLSDEFSANLIYQDGYIYRNGKSTKKEKNKETGEVKVVPVTYDYKYMGQRMTAGLFYQNKNGVHGTLGYNSRKVNGNDYIKKTEVASSADLNSYIFDIQKEWKINDDTLITGYTWKQEAYEGLVKNIKGHRNNHALYLSYHHPFTDKFNMILGLRGERIFDVLKDVSVVTPQIQTLYQINDSTSWYINIGKAFQMPTVDDELKYSTITGLKPESGWTYETGIKKAVSDRSMIKVALYHMDFKNKIGWKQLIEGDPNSYVACNKGNFRNTGVEVEYENDVNDNWSYSFGVGLGNPETKDPSVKSPKWTQDSAKVDMVGTISYHNDKVTSTLSYKYLGDRETYNKKQVPTKSRFTWNTIYRMNKEDTITFTLNNLFNHKNYANRYGNLELPRNWRLSWSHLF